MKTLLTIAILISPCQMRTATTASLDLRAFERIKTLSGNWRSASTKGWTGSGSYRVIARGSVVLYTSAFDDAPESGMATTFFMDGDKLTLTHYCESRTQPTLVAATISPDARTIEFHFHSGTSLPTRNKGHMDQLVMRFVDANHYSSRWTWYQDGKQSWMEEIKYERMQGVKAGSNGK